MLFGKKTGGVQWLVVCLGNPGPKYEWTRHNMGYLVADQIGKNLGIPVRKLRFKALTAECTLGGAKVLLMKPVTYMNLSGEAVGEAARFYKIPPEQILVVSDDVTLPAGKLRIRRSGSAGGHNGLKNIIAHLGTDAFPRIKVGVGSPAHPEHEMIDWVLSGFSPEGKKIIEQAIADAADAAACLIQNGVDAAMNRYN